MFVRGVRSSCVAVSMVYELLEKDLSSKNKRKLFDKLSPDEEWWKEKNRAKWGLAPL